MQQPYGKLGYNDAVIIFCSFCEEKNIITVYITCHYVIYMYTYRQITYVVFMIVSKCAVKYLQKRDNNCEGWFSCYITKVKTKCNGI